MLSLFYSGSELGPPTITLSIFSFKSWPKLRFVVLFCLLGAPLSRASLSNPHDEQVIAPFLIIIQVSNQRSMTGDVVSGDTFTIPSSGEESANVNGTPSDGQSANLSGTGSKTPSELGVKVVTTIDLHHDKT